MGMTLADWEAMYPAKLEAMRGNMSMIVNGQEFFTPSQMQRLHRIGYNHAMHVIEHGLSVGKIIDPKGLHRYQYT